MTVELSEGDEDGVQVTVVNDGTVQNIFGLTAGATVTYDGKTYEHTAGGQIIVNNIEEDTTEAIYDVTDETGAETDLLNMTAESISYVQIVDGAIEITAETSIPVYFGEESTYTPDTYFAKLTAIAASEDGTQATYTFAKREGADDIDGLTINASEWGDSIVINAVFTAEITTAGTVTINGDNYTTTFEDPTLVIATTASSTSLTAGTVDIAGTLNVTGGQTVEVTGDEGFDGVTVTVENADGESTVTSITGMNAGEIVEFENVTYEIFDDGNLLVTTTTEDADTNILELPDEYTAYVNMGEDSSAIVLNALEEGVDGVIYGQGATYNVDTAFAKLTVDEDGAYTLNHGDRTLGLEDVTISVGENWEADTLNITTDFDATIAFNGSATVNEIAFTAVELEDGENILTIAATPELTGLISNLANAISGKAPATQLSISSTPVPAVPVQASTAPETPIAGVAVASAPQFTVDQIMAAGATLMDAGKVEDLMKLLHSFGVQAVTELKPEQLGAFATELRKLGATI